MADDTMRRADVVAILRGLADKLGKQSREEFKTSADREAFGFPTVAAFEHGKSVARGQDEDAVRKLADSIEAEGKRLENHCGSCGLQGGAHLPWCRGAT